MKDAVLKIENLGKQYRLGLVGTGTLSHDLNRWWHMLRGKEDPYLKIGDTNDRTVQGKSKYVWALKDISFEVQRGEVLGIIGKNGAGKSTLLKLLSKVTGPTTGSIKAKGKVASLLEVGTGFHPELTGKENIFLNGAILGMTKKEIKLKFDDIVEFAGVEKYVDTPVKRYSSGMHVRLAFAVAAFLESDILIIDEVLAVGDVEFQKKCLGKINDVSKTGKTVLFVSHNMSTVSNICTRSIMLKNGELFAEGETGAVVQKYLREAKADELVQVWDMNNAPGNEKAKLYKCVVLFDESVIDKESFLNINNPMEVSMEYEILQEVFQPIPQLHFFNERGENAFISYGHSLEEFDERNAQKIAPGKYKSVVKIPQDVFNAGTYYISVGLIELKFREIIFYQEHCLSLTLEEDLEKREFVYMDRVEGVLRPKLNWRTVKI
jgi:lipopolysaccharide transport system ATP-binding protein